MLTTRLRVAVAVLAVAAAIGQAVGARAASVAAPTSPPAPSAGLPDGVPPAALAPEPALPVPAGWPFPDAFPRTSGTGRLAGGAFEWSDFLYDDHGARGTQVSSPIASLAPSVGTYTYADPQAAMNGADIFRTAVGLTADATWWRVDWNTLLDPNLPIAEFTLDTDDNAATGGRVWPAGAGVASAGIDAAIVMSARGAWLVDVATGRRTDLGPPSVDRAARSFVLRVPRALLAPRGTWRVRLASGVADRSGSAFAPVGAANGASAGEPAVYNVTFRSSSQEPEATNYWMDRAQATALAAGDVSGFSATVRWADLAARRTTPEPLPTGYSNRWYVSSIAPGQGISTGGGPGVPVNYLGRVQPYAIYVPTTYTGRTAAPLTWLLHSLDEQHNQYGSLDPHLVTDACEKRDSICVTTLGRGPGGWYFDDAELDFWEVWNRVAGAYRLDPERTVLSGYSMGGWGTYKIGLAHPDLFSKAVVLEAAPVCGTQPIPGYPIYGAGGHCRQDGQSVPVIDSARNLPFVISQGAIDELAPLTGALPEVSRFQQLGYQLRFELYLDADHLAYPIFDEFAEQAAQMNGPPRVRNPAHVSYAWYPALDRPDLGIGSTGAYWVRDTTGRSTAPGVVARIDAVSAALPDPPVTPVTTVGLLIGGSPLFPGVVIDQHWATGASPPRRPTVSVRLTDVGALALDLGRAGVRGPGTVDVTSDGPVTVGVLDAVAGLPVRLDGAAVGEVSAAGVARVPVPGGSHVLTVG